MPGKALGLGLAVVCLISTAFAREPRKPSPPPLKPAAGPSRAMPLARVVLYSNGVAQLERRGKVSGNVEIAIPFKQSQLDDVLKSLLVVDLGRGRINSVSYDSSTPAAARLAEVPFSIGAESDGLTSALRQLQGARVQVSGDGKSVTGKILSIERKPVRRVGAKAGENDTVTTVDRLVVAGDSGELTSFDLDRVTGIRLLDDGARQDVGEFTAATAAARRRDAKTIVVSSAGTGEREMIVRYTIAAPVWKTSYRIVIDGNGQPFVQGWAIVDNTSEEDWTNVALTLVSGSPMSFIQPLQMPLYRHRPVRSLPDDVAIEPQTIDTETYGRGEGSGTMSGEAAGGGYGSGAGGGIVREHSIVTNTLAGMPALSLVKLSDGVLAGDSGVVASTRGDDVGDLFQYSITEPVTVERNRSALIPILQTRLDGERISLYNKDVHAERPLSGIRLKNTSEWTLEAGALTVLDGDDYAGESTIERLKPGDDQMVTYAVDLGTKVSVDDGAGREPVFLLRAINGDMQAHYYKFESRTYTLKNQTGRERVVYVEHPRGGDWRLTKDSPAPAETTDTHYRFRVAIAPHATETLKVSTRQAIMEVYTISNITTKEMEMFVAERYVDEETRAALQALLDMKSRIAAAGRTLEALEAELKDIEADQARLRENIKSLGTSPEARALVARYIAKANEQESRIERITAERNQVRTQRDGLQTQLDNAIRSLAIDRRFDRAQSP